MTDKRDIGDLARRAKHAATKVAHEVSDGANTVADEAREIAKKAFDKVNAARIDVTKKRK